MENIKQKHYADLEIDGREKDIVQIWMNEKTDAQVVQVERHNLRALIDVLEREAQSFKNLNKAPVNGWAGGLLKSTL
jgi:hypothetical protein